LDGQVGGFVGAEAVIVPPRVFATVTPFCTAELVTISLIVTVPVFTWLPHRNALSVNVAVQVLLPRVMVWACQTPSALVITHVVAVQSLNTTAVPDRF